MADAPPFRVAATLHLRHGRLTEVLQERGWSQRDLARYLGVPWMRVNGWMRFRRRPPTEPDVLRKLMELTGCADDELFPPALYRRLDRDRPVTTVTTIREVGIEALPRPRPRLPSAPSAEEVYETTEQRALVQAAVATLSPPEQLVVRQRWGVDGAGTRTLAEIGLELRVSTERVRQIERTALEKLRRPTTARLLRPLVTGERLALPTPLRATGPSSPWPRVAPAPPSAPVPAPASPRVASAVSVSRPVVPPLPLLLQPPLVAPTDLSDVHHRIPETGALCVTPHPCLTGRWYCTCGHRAILHAADAVARGMESA